MKSVASTGYSLSVNQIFNAKHNEIEKIGLKNVFFFYETAYP